MDSSWLEVCWLQLKMTVSKTQYGDWVTLVGTTAEVADALDDEKVTESKLKGIFYDGTAGVTKVTAIYHT